MAKLKLPSPYEYNTFGAYCAALQTAGAAKTHSEAAALARKLIPSEKKIQREILNYLSGSLPPGHNFFWKDAAGPYQQQGIPDIVGVYNGRFFAFEVKRPLLGRVTPIQSATIEKIHWAGGQVYIVTSAAEVRAIIDLEDRR